MKWPERGQAGGSGRTNGGREPPRKSQGGMEDRHGKLFRNERPSCGSHWVIRPEGGRAMSHEKFSAPGETGETSHTSVSHSCTSRYAHAFGPS